MIARLQQCITLTLLLAAAVWCAAWWPAHLAIALGGTGLLLCSHAAFLAVECLAMMRQNRTDAAPRAGGLTVVCAWLHEVLAAPRAFCWRQPFRSQAEPDFFPAAAHDGSLRGVVLVHGLICNRGFWNPWLRLLRERGQPFVAVNLEPVFGGIDGYVAVVDAAVRRVAAATGRAPFLVCHSMGGLAARAWLRAAGDDGRVHRVVTIGTPHAGTWLARHSRAANGRQMRIGSAWLTALAAAETTARRQRFTCFHSNCDNVVFPASTATLPDADNRFIPGRPHIGLAFDPRVIRETLDLLLKA